MITNVSLILISMAFSGCGLHAIGPYLSKQHTSNDVTFETLRIVLPFIIPTLALIVLCCLMHLGWM